MNYAGCSLYYSMYPGTPDIGGHVYVLACNIKIYEVVLNKLEWVKATGDIGHLIDIPGLVFQEKNYFIY